MTLLTSLAISAMEKGISTDGLIRLGIRRLLAKRLADAAPGPDLTRAAAVDAFAAEMRRGPVAPVPEKANEQHYEVPPEFFELVLGPARKYSSCYWLEGAGSLAGAETAALEITATRAGIEDGMSILELGCGWGSLSLFLAERFPGCRITAVSNSNDQRRTIERSCAVRGLTNLRVVTADMNDFEIEERFDRVVSLEMFEHMRNWEELLGRIAWWLNADGKLFLHSFCHRDLAYPFETEGAANWMGKHFFTGGIMPAADLIDRFDRDLMVTDRWTWNGLHYARTCEAWLANMDRHRDEILGLFRQCYGPATAATWFRRWRVFFLACAELFAFRDGGEWMVAHYLLGRRG
jgi:cyclopropane-fatty-acyl-phospholipid synthase